jgi:hypothetical protein
MALLDMIYYDFTKVLDYVQKFESIVSLDRS